MMQKIFAFVGSARRQFFFYALVGSSAFLIDLVSLVLLKEMARLRPVVAVIINQILVINYVFFLNKYISFRSPGRTWKQINRFYLLAGWNYFFAVIWMLIFNERLQFNYLLVRISGIILAVCWNFLLYKYWVYKPLKN